VPVVDMEIKFKRVLEYGDSAVIETTFINTPAAKLIFEYKITSLKHGYIACIGKSTQVFMNSITKELFITMPAFIEEWKKRWKII
jgi:acyl-CoA thioester hydrolase